MKRSITLLVITAVLLSAGAAAVSAQEGIGFNGYVRNYTGVLLDNSDYTSDFSAIENTFDLKADYSGDISDLHAEGYVYSDADDDLTAGVRELYFDIYFDNMDLRVGKQQIIWGKADGVFITDVVSPRIFPGLFYPILTRSVLELPR